jgi:hypothetical protein
VCYRGVYSDKTMDIQDWSSARLEPAGTMSPDGKPYMRNIPVLLKDQRITGFTLDLHYDSRKSDYDWIYNFRLSADVEGAGTLFGAGECPWYEREKGETNGLVCGIDCDGGMFGLTRVAGTKALELTFEPRIGLRMKWGCGGGGSARLMPSSGEISFRLEPVSAQECSPLEEWAKNQ